MKAYAPENIRSFTLAGHAGSGKTSVGDAIARITGLNSRLGSVTDGSSLLDFEPEEKDRGGSVQSAVLSCEFNGFKIHAVDTPGDMDFIHESVTVMQGTGGAVLVVSAIDGLSVGTERTSKAAKTIGLPRVILINKMDADRADHESIVGEVKEVLGVDAAMLQMPIGKGDDFKGVVDLISGKAFLYDGDGGVAKEGDVPANLADDVEAALMTLHEQVAMTDEALMDAYFENETLTMEQMRAGLNKGINAGTIAPVLLCSATKNIGVDRLLHTMTRLQGLTDVAAVPGFDPEDAAKEKSIDHAIDGEPVALCFKTVVDPFVGQLSIFRLLRGTLMAGAAPRNSRVGKEDRIGNLVHLQGKKTVNVDKVVPGDIFAVPKLKLTHTGDTLYIGEAVAAKWLTAPEPMIAYVVKPRTRADEQKVRDALDKILVEDAGLRQGFDDVTKEITLSGMGVNHVALTCARMSRKYGVDVDLGTPTIPYKETFKKRADVRYRHKKQTGGAGQFGEVSIKVEPADAGEGFEFIDEIKGGVIPGQLIPSVEKGIVATAQAGILAGFPVVDFKVRLYDGKYHPVDSKDIAFQIAGRQAIKQAGKEAGMVLLEPINEVEVVAPEAYTGDIMGDMNQRRARISSMETRGRNSVVKALVPLAEMLNYAPSLKSMTGGTGSYSMKFSSYQAVPSSMQDKLVEDISRLKAEAE